MNVETDSDDGIGCNNSFEEPSMDESEIQSGTEEKTEEVIEEVIEGIELVGKMVFVENINSYRYMYLQWILHFNKSSLL